MFFYDPSANRIALSTAGVTEERIESNIGESGFHRILISRLVGDGTYVLYIQINHPNDLVFNWKAFVAFTSAVLVGSISGMMVVTPRGGIKRAKA